jgi:hypothetical protein
MGDIAEGFAATFGDHVSPGIPGSGVKPVSKAQARALGQMIENELASSGASLVFSDPEELPTDVDYRSGQRAEIKNSGNDEIDGTYSYSGGIGGTWARIGPPSGVNTVAGKAGVVTLDVPDVVGLPEALNGKVTITRQVNGGGLVTGGGGLNTDTTLTVTPASTAEVAAGTEAGKAVTPAAMKPQVDRIGAVERTVSTSVIPAELPSVTDLLQIRARGRVPFWVTNEGRVPTHDVGRGVWDELPSDVWREVIYGRGGRVLWGRYHDGTEYVAGLSDDGGGDDASTRYLVDTVGDTPNRYVVAVDPDGHSLRISPPGVDAFAPVAQEDGVLYAEAFGGVTTRRKSVLDFDAALSTSVNALLHIPVLGQSLSLGLTEPPRVVEETPATIPGRTVIFNGGIRTLGNSMNAGLLDTPLSLDLIRDLVPMVERLDQGGGETPWSRCARGVALAQGATKGVLPSCHGISGQKYEKYRKGTVQWANMIRAVQRAKTMMQRLGLAYSVPALCMINGEADREDSLAVFRAKLDELAADMQDLAAISGQSDPVKLFVCQMSSWTAVRWLSDGDYHNANEVPLAQLQAGLENPNVRCVGPKYHLPHAPEGIHLSSPRSYAVHGEYYGRAIAQELAGTPWKPLHPVSVTWNGAVATIQCHVPDGVLAIDTIRVSDPGHYGLTYLQTGGGTPPAISSVALGGDGTSIGVTMSGAPTGAQPGFGLGAFGAVADKDNGPALNGGPTTGPRTCFRDTSADLSEFGGNLYNWMCHSIVRAA